MEVLRTKHLVTLPPSVASLDSYPKRPLEIVSVNITEDTVMYVGRRLSIRAGTGGGGLSELLALDHVFRSGKRGVASDISRVCGVAREWAPPLGRLLWADERPVDFTGQAVRVQAGWSGRNMAAPHVEVCLGDYRAGFQGRLWNRAAGWRSRSGH